MPCSTPDSALCVPGDSSLCEPPDIVLDCDIMPVCDEDIPVVDFSVTKDTTYLIAYEWKGLSDIYEIEIFLAGVENHGLLLRIVEPDVASPGVVSGVIPLGTYPVGVDYTIFMRRVNGLFASQWTTQRFNNPNLAGYSLDFSEAKHSFYVPVIL